MRRIVFESAKVALNLQANGQRCVGAELGRGPRAVAQQPSDLAAELSGFGSLNFFSLFLPFSQQRNNRMERYCIFVSFRLLAIFF